MLISELFDPDIFCSASNYLISFF